MKSSDKSTPRPPLSREAVEDAEKAVTTYLAINPEGEFPPADMIMTDPVRVARVYWKAVKTGKMVEVRAVEGMPDRAVLVLV